MERGPTKRVVVIGADKDRYRYLSAAGMAFYQPAAKQMLSESCFLIAVTPRFALDFNSIKMALTMGRRVAVVAPMCAEEIDEGCELYADLAAFEESMIAQRLDEMAVVA